MKRIASTVPRITDWPYSDSIIDNCQVEPEEQTKSEERAALEELETRTPEARIPETTLTLGEMPANLLFAGELAHVDLSAGQQTRSQVAVLMHDYDTDENFAFIVTNGLSLQDALQQDDALKWRQAIDSEVASLQYYQVFRQVDANQSGNIIPTKIILIKKWNDQGEVERHKARLVAQRFFQRSGFDFDAEAAYVPTVDLTVLRLLLAKTASDDLAIWQYDVKTAYLYKKLEELVLARLPKELQFDGGKLRVSADLCLGTGRNSSVQLVHLAKALPDLRQ